MPQSLSNVVIHATFSTFQRAPTLTPSVQQELFPYIAQVLLNIGCNSIQVGGFDDHIHALFALSRTKTIAQAISNMKTSSSSWLKTKEPHLREFSWQEGYAAFSVGQDSVEAVRRYILNQREHHKSQTFEEELRAILVEQKIPFDERYFLD